MEGLFWIALLLLLTGANSIVCFMLGAKLGQTVSKGEEIKLPNLNPLDAYRAHEARREAEVEQEIHDTILQNVECYDGTSNGQKDVPGR